MEDIGGEDGIIDVHTHYVPRGWPDLRDEAGPDALWLDIVSESDAIIKMGTREFRHIKSTAWDAETRVRDMNADGVARQVVSPTPAFFGYDLAPDSAAKVARIFNDLALSIVEPCPDRLIPFCQVPLHDTDLACRELERCIANGHRGVEIGNHVGDHDLDSAGVVTFLQHCAALDVPVFVHPWDMQSTSRLNRWMGQWLVGMPSETHLSILALILGGGFDVIDPRLRIAFAHGGGSFAFWLGRVENAWQQRNDVVGTSAYPPSHYIGRFYVDSVVFDDRALRVLVDTVGADRVLVGSDYPYPLGERPVGDVVRRSAFLDERQRRQIASENALVFLGGSTPTSGLGRSA
ncbi:amidohydrolase family protein [Gordonia aichiensis]|uniref:2-amino-3-carboxymuconate-6-semialdehyde decarboxylase n=1 Tax=Gordonia aichiensis NBRC 108223 TaxID=1220583 RepID=L7KR41_9ACTN|nr:amidohydrolase family protein [Gordonia aichiensis]GAC51074.1 putative 2-amino-3-carboxymuconate-6-semialdehyde decarboxylase [Gordonia aichiensis NBRC 108223]